MGNNLHKLAVFVEGHTELLFIDKFISQICGEKLVTTEHREIKGGGKRSNVPRAVSITKAAKINQEKRFYILICDCAGHQQVANRIREEHENLTRLGYSKIIGIRDVYPDFTHAQIPQLEIGLRKYIKTSLIPVEFILAIMEIEAWFMAEFNHFLEIDSQITVDEIHKRLGFNPANDDLSQRYTPAEDISSAYAIGGKAYAKGVDTTIEALNYEYMYADLPNRIPYLKRLCDSIDDFFALHGALDEVN